MFVWVFNVKSVTLQFGIKDSVAGGVKWYGCQGNEREKMHIPGYLGTLQCPDATAFCEMEDISGRFYTENSKGGLAEYILVGSVILIPIVVFLLC